MTKKYKIYISEKMKKALISDAEIFGFAKKDGSVNLNGFIKELLVNYYDEYCTNISKRRELILNDFTDLRSLSKKDAGIIADRIIGKYIQSNMLKGGRSTALTITVSAGSLDVIKSIENNFLSEISLSQYINNLMAAYFTIPQKDREIIIFRETFEELRRAIKSKKVITFSSAKAASIIFRIRPYIIAVSKNDGCNYLLCSDDGPGIPRSFKISQIHALYTTKKFFKPSEEMLREFKESSAYLVDTHSEMV